MASGSILSISQQRLAGERVNEDLQFKLDRACTVHSLAAARVILQESIVTPAEVVAFVDTYGAQTGSMYYSEGHGWRSVPLADSLRALGYKAIMQNLNVAPHEFNRDAAQKSRRVVSPSEITIFENNSEFGGAERSVWQGSLSQTLDANGVVLASIQIPLRSGYGTGGHSVLLTDIDPVAGECVYFDPDLYNIDRLKDSAVPIERCNEDQLLYRRGISNLLEVMTGEVIHIFPPEKV